MRQAVLVLALAATASANNATNATTEAAATTAAATTAAATTAAATTAAATTAAATQAASNATSAPGAKPKSMKMETTNKMTLPITAHNTCKKASAVANTNKCVTHYAVCNALGRDLNTAAGKKCQTCKKDQKTDCMDFAPSTQTGMNKAPGTWDAATKMFKCARRLSEDEFVGELRALSTAEVSITDKPEYKFTETSDFTMADTMKKYNKVANDKTAWQKLVKDSKATVETKIKDGSLGAAMGIKLSDMRAGLSESEYGDSVGEAYANATITATAKAAVDGAAGSTSNAATVAVSGLAMLSAAFLF